jgi:hypothetical protein
MAGFVVFFCIGEANFLFPKLAAIRGMSPQTIGLLFFRKVVVTSARVVSTESGDRTMR